jgi:predicted N-acyltransferase
MRYIAISEIENGGYREAQRLLASLKSARRELRAERRKIRRPRV